MLLNKVCLKFGRKQLFIYCHCWDAKRVTGQRVGVCMLSAGTMFVVVVVFSETRDPPSDLIDGLFKSFQSLECAVISTHFKLSTENVATEMAQRIDKRRHFFAGNCVFAFGFYNVQLKYETRCSTFGFTICESTLPMPTSFASQSTINGLVKSWYARVIVSANAAFIVVKELSQFFVHWNFRLFINNLLSGYTICT